MRNISCHPLNFDYVTKEEFRLYKFGEYKILHALEWIII